MGAVEGAARVRETRDVVRMAMSAVAGFILVVDWFGKICKIDLVRYLAVLKEG